MTDYGPSSQIIRHLHTQANPGESTTHQPVLSTAFHLDPQGLPETYTYWRSGSPGITALEDLITTLDSTSRTIVTGSGMAAITIVFRALLSSGDTLVIPTDGYYSTRKYAQDFMTKWGVRVIEFSSTSFLIDLQSLDIIPRLVFVETPTNPGLEIIDIAEVAAWCKHVGALCVVDNTTATPLGQHPIDLGADIVIVSGTKHLSGHSDLAFGYSGFADDNTAELVYAERTLSGSLLSGSDAWLAARSIATYPLRFAQQNRSAQVLAEFFDQHKNVKSVRYPGLSTDSGYHIASKQMLSYGSMLAVTLASPEYLQKFLSQGELIGYATSFGGVQTTVDPRARWGDSVGDSFMRFSVGIEDIHDLLAECERLLH